MGCRIGVPFFGLDRRVRAAAFFVGGSGAYSRFALEDSKFEHLRADEQLFFELTDPIAFAHMSAGRPVFLANGRRDDLVGLEAAERLQQAMGEPKTLRWFDGGHAESPLALFDEAATSSSRTCGRKRPGRRLLGLAAAGAEHKRCHQAKGNNDGDLSPDSSPHA